MIDYKVELFVDAEWQDITSDVRNAQPLTMNRGRRDWAAVTDPATLSLRLNNGASKVSQGQLGRYSPRNPRSDLYGKIGRNTPVRVVRGDTGAVRFSGEMSEWPQQWDLSGNDVWVKAKAAGVLRRLGKSSSPLASAISRFITDNEPLEYWPLTDGPASGRVPRSAVEGGSNYLFLLRDPAAPTGLIFTRPDWQGADAAPWLEPIIRPAGTRGISRGPVRSGSTTSWVVDFIRYEIGGIDSFNVVTQSGNIRDTWFIGEDPTVEPREIFINLMSEDLDNGTSSIASLSAPATPGAALFNDVPHHMRLEVEDTGGSMDWTLYLDGDVLLSGSRAVTSKPITQIQYEWWVQDDGVSGFIGLGHFTVWPLADAPSVTDMASATRGFAGETAARRIERLCMEQGVNLATVGGLDESPPMGPQRIEPFLTLLRQAEEVDGGVLGEDLDTNALGYRTGRSQYNKAPTLVLDYTHGVIGEPFEPVDDDQLLANDITAERIDGGRAQAVDEDGPLSVQDPPDGVGRYDKSVTLNVETDAQLPSQAGWRLHLGTVDEARFPFLRLDLRNPRVEAIEDDVLAVGLGDIIRITNPPEWLPPGPYDLYVEAIAESKSAVTHVIEFTCTPASVWNVGELDNPNLGRLDTGGSSVAEDLTPATSTFRVLTDPGSQRWIDSADYGAQFPFNIAMGGEVMEVTAISPEGGSDSVGEGDGDDTASLEAVAPSVDAPGSSDLLVCAWSCWDESSIVWEIPASMTESDQTAGSWSRLADATEELTASGATGTRTATRTFEDTWAAISVVLSDSSGMLPVVEEYLSGVDGSGADVDLTTSASTEIGWYMLAIHGHDNGRSGLPAAPLGGGWELVADSGLIVPEAPVLAVYAKRVTVAGSEAVTFQAGSDSDDNQARLYVVSATVGQMFTVNRAVNGIEKSHTTGDSLSLDRPLRLAL